MPDSFDLSEGATRGYLAAGTALLWLTAVRALYRLDVPAFWFDEAVSWRNINGTWLFQVRRAQGGEDLGGFLYSAILKLWSSVAGCSEYALRFPSVLFALALVGVLWVLGRLLWGQLAGLCVAATATILPGYLDYAREARGYSFLMLATAVAVLGLVVYRKKRRWGEWLLLLGTGAAIATHSFGLFVWAGVTGAHLWLVWKLDKPGRSIRAWFHAGAALLPPIVSGIIWTVGTRKTIMRYIDSFWLNHSILSECLALLPLVLPVAAALIVLARDRRKSAHRLAAASILALVGAPILAGPAALSAAVGGDHHFILFRYFLGLLPLAALAGGYLLSRLRAPLAAALTVALLAAAMVHPYTRRQYEPGGRLNRPIRAVVSFLRDNVSPADCLLVSPPHKYLTLHYYGLNPSFWGDQTENLFSRRWAQYRAGEFERRTWVVFFESPDTFDIPPERLNRPPVVSAGSLTIYRYEPALIAAPADSTTSASCLSGTAGVQSRAEP